MLDRYVTEDYTLNRYDTEDYTLKVVTDWGDYKGEMYGIVNKETNVTEHAAYALPSAINSIVEIQRHYDATKKEAKTETQDSQDQEVQ